MEQRTRQTVLIVFLVFLVLFGAAWWYMGFTFDLSRFFAAEPFPTASGTPQATAVRCTPNSRTVAVGANAAFLAQDGSAPYQWFAPNGSPATGTGASFTVSYSTPGTKKVTVQAQRSVYRPEVDSVACTVIVTP